jgi:hypothetical protein
VEYLRRAPQRFDIINASGVLYHQRNSAELIALVSRASDAIIIWTQYYDEAVMAADPLLRRKFSGKVALEYEGFRYEAQRHEYGRSIYLPWYCGGSASYSHWMTRQSILDCLGVFGLTKIRIAYDHPAHPNGPSFLVAATKS